MDNVIDGDAEMETDTETTPFAWTFPRVHVEGRTLVDELGRQIMLRGINAGGRAKLPPHLPWEGSFDEADFADKLGRYMDFPADWGMNVLRLTVFWEAIEPVRGEYNENYLNFVKQQVQAAAERGLYVFIDFHQDMFSRYLGGSGAPAWTLEDPPEEAPALDDPGWVMRVFSDQTVLHAFDRFWANEDGIQDAYIDMATETANRLSAEPNMLGIDLMNEPNPGNDGASDPTAWYNEKLIPFYSSLAQHIRENSPHFIIFVEPSGLEAGQGETELGWSLGDMQNVVVSPHYYYPIQFIMGEYDGKQEALETAMHDRDALGEALDAPILLSEYGFRGLEGDTGMDENAAWFFEDFYRAMDEVLMHGTVWTHEVSSSFWNREDCTFTNGDWSERIPRTDAISRPYPEFTNGILNAFDYDPGTHAIQMRYQVNANSLAPTVIRLPRRHYPSEPQVSLAFGSATFVEEFGVLLVNDNGALEGGQEQIIELTP
jgi:endoglycosylceramidase